MLTEKVLLNTLSEECGSCITTPTNLNFCCYSSLPQVPIMAKEIIGMRLPGDSLKHLKDLFDESSDKNFKSNSLNEKNRRTFESNCLDEAVFIAMIRMVITFKYVFLGLKNIVKSSGVL
jgi:hypothetical protein